MRNHSVLFLYHTWRQQSAMTRQLNQVAQKPEALPVLRNIRGSVHALNHRKY